ncbi:MAG: DNA methyltransferase, partial [Bacteroidota bacterium]|nr:DNA methyltransferase [Bacteroidota bacterium]
MPLSWNEIKPRAIKFSKEWENAEKENADSQPFWIDFFNVFGISQRRVSSFEHSVKKLGNKDGRIDLFWKGRLIIEHKSKGRDLDKAFQQAIDYFPGLKEEELPKYILVSDFENFRLYDLDENTKHDFLLSELHKNIKLFGFIAGYQKIVIREEDPINIKAAEKMGKLHDLLKEIGYEGHELEIYLVRLLFMLFADDTGIFEKDILWDFIENHTNEDGSDLAPKIAQLFQVLDTPNEKRLKNLDEIYSQFPYVNGKLFEENLRLAAFDSKMRKILLESCAMDWSLISPAIFGSLFQSIMDKNERRNLGAHYTSEKNIMKLIKPLFLDELWEEFHKIKGNSRKLAEFHKQIGELKFFDPACGSGNFLIIAYRELRLLEFEILKTIYKDERVTSIENIIWISIDQFYGIEIDEWASRIAEVAMWLIDHQLNMQISEKFGKYFVRIPIKKTANIIHANSLQTDWESLVSKKELSYILGNPPFIGKYLQTKKQKEDLKLITAGIKGASVLDYVACWYLKASAFIQDTKIETAFVSTNSISQGEQVSILWNEMFNKYKIKIHFAHRTFRWDNEAKSNAAVHVVIIGFANFDSPNKTLFDYEDIKSDAHEIKAKNINPYLIEGNDFTIIKQRKSICNAQKISFGSMPND